MTTPGHPRGRAATRRPARRVRLRQTLTTKSNLDGLLWFAPPGGPYDVHRSSIRVPVRGRQPPHRGGRSGPAPRSARRGARRSVPRRLVAGRRHVRRDDLQRGAVRPGAPGNLLLAGSEHPRRGPGETAAPRRRSPGPTGVPIVVEPVLYPSVLLRVRTRDAPGRPGGDRVVDRRGTLRVHVGLRRSVHESGGRAARLRGDEPRPARPCSPVHRGGGGADRGGVLQPGGARRGVPRREGGAERGPGLDPRRRRQRHRRRTHPHPRRSRSAS